MFNHQYDQLSVWIVGAALAVAMLVAWAIGGRIGLRTRRMMGGGAGGDRRVDEATLALLGLLLAFSFSGASGKHDARKLLVVEEAAAVGDLAGAVATLDDPERESMRQRLREYMDLRIAASRLPLVDDGHVALDRKARGLQAALTSDIATAVRSGNHPSIHEELVSTLNEVTTAYERRLAASDDHLPLTVVLMLSVSAVVGAFSLGRIQGLTRRREIMPMAIFVVLVTLVFAVTLDLEQPRRGTIKVSVAALERVRATL